VESTLSGKTIVGSGHGIKAMIRCGFIILAFMSIVFILLTVFSLTMESSLRIPFLFFFNRCFFSTEAFWQIHRISGAEILLRPGIWVQ